MELGTITTIDIIEEKETPEFFERARIILDDIMNKQSLDVDTVSGATYSSAGILNAVTNALETAVIERELEQNSPQLSPPPNHEQGNRNRKRRRYGLDTARK